MASVLELVKHYQHNIERYQHDAQRVLRCIDKLFHLDVTVQHLQETGVGRTVNALRKEPGEVGKAARALVYKWKLMVAAEESDQEGDLNDSANHNGHSNGRDSEDNRKSRQEPKQTNGDYTAGKRKYHSSEEETDLKRSKHSSCSDDDKRKQVKVKSESSDSESESSDSQSDESDSQSSEEERKEVKIKVEPPEKQPSSSKQSNHNNSDSSNSKRSQEASENYSSKQIKVEKTESSRHSDKSSKSSHSSSKHSKHSSTKEKEHSPEKKQKEHKSSDKEKPREESRSSSKHSSDKHRSSSQKTDSGSEKHRSHEKSKSDRHSSSKSDKDNKDKDRQKSSSDKESSSDKHKTKESSSSKEKSSSSKDKSKDRSKEKSSSHSSKSDKKHSSSSDKQRSDIKIKSEKIDDQAKSESSEKKASKSSSSSEKNKTSSNSKSKGDKPKKKVTVNTDIDEGIGCESGASFAEALGMVLPSKPKKKQSSTPVKDAPSPGNPPFNDLAPALLLAPASALAPLPALEIGALPDISPNYKPRPPPKFQPHFTDEDAMCQVISSKNQRTKVYSGNKVIGKIPTLYEMCVHVLQEHIDALEYTGGVPYEILKPVVDRATPQQLFLLEHYNAYLMDDTDHLWQNFCEKHFRNKKRQEMETWREMYMRCQEEQEHKLKSLTANIRMTQEAKKAPIKQTKMAYVDSVVKPPRNVARKQAQHGTAFAASASPAARVAALAAAPNVLRGGRAAPAPVLTSSGFQKPKKAPLMQKALQFMRGRKR